MSPELMQSLISIGGNNLKYRLRISLSGIRSIVETLIIKGSYECPKCGFVMQLNVMYMKSGTIGADTTVADRACPNDGELMVPLTYKRAYAQLRAASIKGRKSRGRDQGVSFSD